MIIKLTNGDLVKIAESEETAGAVTANLPDKGWVGFTINKFKQNGVTPVVVYYNVNHIISIEDEQ